MHPVAFVRSTKYSKCNRLCLQYLFDNNHPKESFNASWLQVSLTFPEYVAIYNTRSYSKSPDPNKNHANTSILPNQHDISILPNPVVFFFELGNSLLCKQRSCRRRCGEGYSAEVWSIRIQARRISGWIFAQATPSVLHLLSEHVAGPDGILESAISRGRVISNATFGNGVQQLIRSSFPPTGVHAIASYGALWFGGHMATLLLLVDNRSADTMWFSLFPFSLSFSFDTPLPSLNTSYLQRSMGVGRIFYANDKITIIIVLKINEMYYSCFMKREIRTRKNNNDYSLLRPVLYNTVVSLV